GWWGIVPDKFKTPGGVWLPRGFLLRYREWYGVKKDADGRVQANVGLKLPAEKVGAQLWAKEQHDPPIMDGVLDPACFAEDGGPSIEEMIRNGSGGKIMFRRADN